MDGLTIRNGQSLLNTGRTASEIRAREFDPPQAQKSASANTEAIQFQDVLRNAITETNQLQKTADLKAQDLATGRTTNITDVMMAVEKADIALRLMTQVRNKIVDAYTEIMKMQV